MPARTARLAASLATACWLATCGAPAPAEAGEPPPLRTGGQERVQVRLVTLDVVVEDRKGRTVPGLGAEDFSLFVDGRRVPVDTLDESCPEAMEPVRAGREPAWPDPAAPHGTPRRIILAFDYLHLPLLRTDSGVPLMAHTRALQHMRRAIEAMPPGDEEIMIAVLDGGLRIEQPFTRDRARTLATLERMEMDVTLFAGHFVHASETPLFAGLKALVDLADTVPGSKALVLFSGGAGPDDSYDPDFREIEAHAGMARVAFYPVDCKGLDQSRLAFR